LSESNQFRTPLDEAFCIARFVDLIRPSAIINEFQGIFSDFLLLRRPKEQPPSMQMGHPT
jgi:hypothetical protein